MTSFEGIKLMLDHFIGELPLLQNIMTIIHSTCDMPVSELRTAITTVHNQVHQLCRRNHDLLEHLQSNATRVFPNLQPYPQLNPNCGLVKSPQLFKQNSLMNLVQTQLQSSSNVKVTFEHKTSSETQRITLDSQRTVQRGNVDSRYGMHGYGDYHGMHGYGDHQISTTSDYVSVDAMDFNNENQFESSYAESSSTTREYLEEAIDETTTSNRSLRMTPISVRRTQSTGTHHQEAHHSTVERNRSNPPYSDDNLLTGSTIGDNTNSICAGLAVQCLRQSFDVFIKDKLSSNNDWYKFERLGLALSEQEINHINENHKADAYARKFEKLLLWSKKFKFKSKSELDMKLDDALVFIG